MRDMKRLAIIPARSGSKGLPDKNIRLLAGKPLMAYSIEAAGDSGLFDRIYVSTDSEEYKKIGEDYGASAPFLRPENLATDTASSWDVVKQALTVFDEMGETYDEIALLQPTSPLRSAADIRMAHALMEERDAKAVIGVCPMEHSPLWSNTLPEDGSMAGFIRPETVRLGRQALPEHYRINGAVYWIQRACLENIEMLYEDQCFAYVMPAERSVDIDTLADFYLAEALLKAGGV